MHLSKDFINGSFEFLAAAFQSMNVRKLWQDKIVRGVHWLPTVFFTGWGVWNLYLYPSLGMWVSLFGGMSIALVNLVWLMLIWKFRKKPHSTRV